MRIHDIDCDLDEDCMCPASLDAESQEMIPMGLLIGIDPGVSGAIAVVGGGQVACYEMPAVEINGKRRVDPAGLHGVLAGILAAGDCMAILEHVQGVQGTGATSAFSFGRSFGIVEGVLAGMAIPHTLVRPQVWTKALGVSRDKGSHRAAAARLWPKHADLFSRVKDDGRADAALLCHWYERCHGATTLG
jgi:crossover junction endodeoxyribonuclease RuvC